MSGTLIDVELLTMLDLGRVVTALHSEFIRTKSRQTAEQSCPAVSASMMTAAVKNAKDPEGVYFGTKLLLALGKEGDVKAACETAVKLVTGSPGDLKSVAYGGAAAKAAGCPVSLGSVEAKVSETLTTAYQVG